MSNLLVSKIMAVMVANSKAAPSTPTRRGMAAWSQEPLPTEGEDFLCDEYWKSFRLGGMKLASRTPILPQVEEKIDRREGKRETPPEVEFRLAAYQRAVDEDRPIDFLPYSEGELERLLTKSKKERIGKLAEAVKIGKMD